MDVQEERWKDVHVITEEVLLQDIVREINERQQRLERKKKNMKEIHQKVLEEERLKRKEERSKGTPFPPAGTKRKRSKTEQRFLEK